MGGDWFSVTMVPANRVGAMCWRWEGGEKSSGSVLL